MSIADLIDHIENERAEADYWREQGEAGTITLDIEQADLLSGLLLETYGFLLNVPRGGGEIADQIACLAVALKGKDV